MEVRNKVRGIAHDMDVAKVTVLGVPDRPGIASTIFEPLAKANVSVDTIVQNASVEGITDLTFTVTRNDLPKAVEWAMFGCMWTNGQICSATSRLILHESIAPQFLARLKAECERVNVCDPLAEGCRLGPVVSDGQCVCFSRVCFAACLPAFLPNLPVCLLLMCPFAHVVLGCPCRVRYKKVRALIDSELMANGGLATPACEEAFQEICGIYSAEDAEFQVMPPSAAAVKKRHGRK